MNELRRRTPAAFDMAEIIVEQMEAIHWRTLWEKPEFVQAIGLLVAPIGAVGKEMAQPRKEIVDGGDDERSTLAVLHVGGVHFGCEQQAGCVADDMPLAALDFLRRIETARSASLSGL